MYIDIQTFFIALFVTILTEFIVLSLILKPILKTKIRIWFILLVVILFDIITLSILWFVIFQLLPFLWALILGEIFVWFVESIFIKYLIKVKFVKAMLFSFLINLASYLMGEILYALNIL